HRRHAINGLEQPLALVVGHERLGELTVDFEALAGDLGIVVGPSAAGFLGPVGDTRYECIGVRGDRDDSVQPQALLLEHLPQGIRLRHGSWEAVEDEAIGAIPLVDPLGNDAVDDLVRNEVAAIHDFLGGEAHRGPVGDRLAQDVAGRELRNPQAFDQNLGLRALADARRPQKNEPQRFRPPSLDRFTSPSYCCAMRWDWIWLMVSSVTVT